MKKEILIASICSFIGGFLEIYSYILKDGVFATTITGDIVLIAHNLSKYNFDIIKYIVPIISFFIGTVIAYKLDDKKMILFLKILCIFLIYIFKDSYYNLLTISLIAIISAMQTQAFGKIGKLQYMSTMMTGNTKRLAVSIAKKDKIEFNISSSLIISFLLGAAIGSVLIRNFREVSIIFLILPIIIVFIDEKRGKNE